MELKKYLLHLKSSSGFVIADAEYQFDEDNDLAILKLFIDGNIIEVSGECTEGVFMKISRILSDRYEIHSCYTCRYGNFCPVGDRDNEIFCINDFEPKRKEDILYIFQNGEEMKKRSRTLFYICDGYKPCDDNYWTYK